MFAYNDNIRLTATNARDRDGKLLQINIPLPFSIKKVCLPENVSQLSIFEYHEGIEVYGHCAFNIYVGQTATFEELIDNKVKIRINNNFQADIKSSKEQLVYSQREDGVLDIFASIQGNDIVVKNVEELNETLKLLSNEISAIKRSVAKIRKLSYKSNTK